MNTIILSLLLGSSVYYRGELVEEAPSVAKSGTEIFQQLTEVTPSSELLRVAYGLDHYRDKNSAQLSQSASEMISFYSKKAVEFDKRGLTFDEFQNFARRPSEKKSPYFLFPNVNSEELEHAFAIMGLGPVSKQTKMDHIHRGFYQWKKTTLPSSSEHRLVSLAYDQIEKLGSFANISELEDFLHSRFTAVSRDIYFQYPDLSEETIRRFYRVAIGKNPEPMSVMDEKYRSLYRWQQAAEAGSDEARLASLLAERFVAEGSWGDFKGIQSWSQTITEDQFSAFPRMAVVARDRFEAITETASPLKQAYFAISEWKESLAKGTPAYRFALTMINDIKAVQNGEGTIEEFQETLLSYPEERDVYFQFPGLARSDLQRAYSVAKMKMAPSPTVMDRAHAKIYRWYRETPTFTPDSELALALLNETEALGSLGKMRDLQKWMHVNYALSGRDIYMRHPEASNEAIATLYELTALGEPPRETPLDRKYREAYAWRSHVNSQSETGRLLGDLLAQMERAGSYGEFAHVQNWAKQVTFTHFNDQAIIPEFDQLHFRALAEVNISLREVLYKAHEILDRGELTPRSPAYKLVYSLVHKAEAFDQENKTFADLKETFADLFSTKRDLYFQYPGLSRDEAQIIYDLTFLGTAPPPTPIDEVYTKLYRLHQKNQFSGADSALLSAAMAQVMKIGSQGSVDDLHKWFEATFVSSGQDVYFQYPGVSFETTEKLYGALGLGKAPHPTVVDTKIAETLSWLSTLKEGSRDHILASKLLEKLYEVGSYGDFETVQAWAQDFVNRETSRRR